jgi:hypothetical protein
LAAARSFAPTRVRSDPGNKRPGQLQWRERKEGESSRGDSTSREGELAVRLQWRGRRLRALTASREEQAPVPIYRRTRGGQFA